MAKFVSYKKGASQSVLYGERGTGKMYREQSSTVIAGQVQINEIRRRFFIAFAACILAASISTPALAHPTGISAAISKVLEPVDLDRGLSVKEGNEARSRVRDFRESGLRISSDGGNLTEKWFAGYCRPVGEKFGIEYLSQPQTDRRHDTIPMLGRDSPKTAKTRMTPIFAHDNVIYIAAEVEFRKPLDRPAVSVLSLVDIRGGVLGQHVGSALFGNAKRAVAVAQWHPDAAAAFLTIHEHYERPVLYFSEIDDIGCMAWKVTSEKLSELILDLKQVQNDDRADRFVRE